MEQEAERLYKLVVSALQRVGMRGILTIAADAKAGTPFAKASSKTRETFLELAKDLKVES